jgi:hypothetical protein
MNSGRGRTAALMAGIGAIAVIGLAIANRALLHARGMVFTAEVEEGRRE